MLELAVSNDEARNISAQLSPAAAGAVVYFQDEGGARGVLRYPAELAAEVEAADPASAAAFLLAHARLRRTQAERDDAFAVLAELKAGITAGTINTTEQIDAAFAG